MQLRLRLFVGLVLCSFVGLSGVRAEDAPFTPAAPTIIVHESNPADAGSTPKESQQGKTVVLWISTDGCRGDYVDRDQTPFLKSLMDHGAYSKQLTPMFPSLTFPSHTTEATGVPAGQHGVTSNKFYTPTVGQGFTTCPATHYLFTSKGAHYG